MSFAFCLPGAPSKSQSDACSHELVPPICILALPYCCGCDKQKEEAICLKRAKFGIAEEMATGWPCHPLRCKAAPATSDYRNRWKLDKVISEMTNWRGELCKYQRIWCMALTPSSLAKLSMHPTVHAIREQGCGADLLLILLWPNDALGKSPDARGLAVTTMDALFNIIARFQTAITTKPHDVTDSRLFGQARKKEEQNLCIYCYCTSSQTLRPD